MLQRKHAWVINTYKKNENAQKMGVTQKLSSRVCRPNSKDFDVSIREIVPIVNSPA